VYSAARSRARHNHPMSVPSIRTHTRMADKVADASNWREVRHAFCCPASDSRLGRLQHGANGFARHGHQWRRTSAGRQRGRIGGWRTAGNRH
jgi:hypothetical protein